PSTTFTTALSFFSSLIPPPPSSTLFPYTTLFRSPHDPPVAKLVVHGRRREVPHDRAVVLPGGHELPAVRREAHHVHLVGVAAQRSEEHTSELQSPCNLVCRLLLEKKKQYNAGNTC